MPVDSYIPETTTTSTTSTTSQMEVTISKLVFSYNSFFSDFLKLAKTISPSAKTNIKLHYRSINRRDPAHIVFGRDNLPVHLLAKPRANLTDDEVDDVNMAFIAKGLTLGDIMGCEDKVTRIKLLQDVYMLSALAQLYDGMGLESVESPEPLLQIILGIQSAGKHPELDKEIMTIHDSVIRGLLEGLSDLHAEDAENTKQQQQQSSQNAPPDIVNAFSGLEKTKMGALLQEIAQEIDISSLDTDPENLLNFANLTDPKSFLSTTISKFGSKLTSKMESGELNKEEILSDAMNLFKNMGMPGLGGGGAQGADFLKNLDFSALQNLGMQLSKNQ